MTLLQNLTTDSSNILSSYVVCCWIQTQQAEPQSRFYGFNEQIKNNNLQPKTMENTWTHAQGARAEQHRNPKMTTGNGWGDNGVTGGTKKE